MKTLPDYLDASLKEVQIAHAVDSGDFIPADEKYEGSWIDFWEDNVSDAAKIKYEKGIGNCVGAHVIDANSNVYIMPCEKKENFQQGQLGSMLERKYLSVPKDALVKVSENDCKRKESKSISWSKFLENNKKICEHMKKMQVSQFTKRW